jgi:hypothetical protein
MASDPSKLIDLTPHDIERIVDLERRSFIPPLQVLPETLQKRFDLGHQMLGIEESGRLIAMASFCYCAIDPADFTTFPKTMKELCQLPQPAKFETELLYNLEVEPQSRGHVHWRVLVKEVCQRGAAAGCRHGLANARIPSYAGSDSRYSQERIAQQPEVQRAIDAYLGGGPFPSDETLMKDPLLAIYRRFTGCRFLWIVPGLAPDDIATGGIRAVVHVDLVNSMTKSPDKPETENRT